MHPPRLISTGQLGSHSTGNTFHEGHHRPPTAGLVCPICRCRSDPLSLRRRQPIHPFSSRRPLKTIIHLHDLSHKRLTQRASGAGVSRVTWEVRQSGRPQLHWETAGSCCTSSVRPASTPRRPTLGRGYRLDHEQDPQPSEPYEPIEPDIAFRPNVRTEISDPLRPKSLSITRAPSSTRSLASPSHAPAGSRTSDLLIGSQDRSVAARLGL